jgi:hypothetical protein
MIAITLSGTISEGTRKLILSLKDKLKENGYRCEVCNIIEKYSCNNEDIDFLFVIQNIKDLSITIKFNNSEGLTTLKDALTNTKVGTK